MSTHPTRCRICESACGLLATVEDGVVTRLVPNADHPLSRGYACRKGPAFAQVQNHPKRVTTPLLRGPDGLAPTTWDDALATLGPRLGSIAREHGPDSVGLYLGNATAHSLGAVLGSEALRTGVGTSKGYSALTLDNSEMFVVLEEVMGNAWSNFLADYDHSDLVVLIGTDPVASQPSQIQSRPGAISTLLERARADQLIVVDPRRSETAKRCSWHVRPRPGGDASLLAWLVREALASPSHRDRATTDALLD
ncbi:MAG: molybdopterin-dependent oxidoreductase, partial [Deltaproteobacteria bacterium]|nr:molybdopterin-dependent oxidoreductase [Deltaproteobacteria bacterium]